MSPTDAPNTAERQPNTAHADVSAIPIQVIRGVVVASIQVDLEESVLARFQDDLLCLIHESDPIGVVFDLSALDTLDAEEFTALRRVVAMTRVMGTRTVLVGLRPGVVSALIQVGADTEGLETAIDQEAAYSLFEANSASETEHVEDALFQDLALTEIEEPAVEGGS